MSHWPSSKAKKVYKALLRIGWTEHHLIKGSSHQQLKRPGSPDFTWAFHDSDEIGPKMLARIAKHTGLTPQDL
jgi:predicted RNA binding protein YcfA (HicA-like mRNA interferase family)